MTFWTLEVVTFLEHLFLKCSGNSYEWSEGFSIDNLGIWTGFGSGTGKSTLFFWYNLGSPNPINPAIPVLNILSPDKSLYFAVT